MSNVTEMFKWMGIGFAGIGVVALGAIVVGRFLIKHCPESGLERPPKCACGRQASCLQGDFLGVCNKSGRFRFVREGQLSARPSRRWVFGCSLFVLWLVGAILGWPYFQRGFSGDPRFLFAIGSLIWGQVVYLFQKPERP